MNIHMTLQGKGGVGKSYVAYILSQYLREKGEILCIDTDPVNHTLSSIKSLDVKFINILNDENIDQRNFDKLIEVIFSSKGKNENCVIDCGSSSFIPFTTYIQENDIIDFFKENGLTIYIHVILTGGQSLEDTVRGLDYIIKKFSITTKIVIWLNEFFGKVMNNNKKFEEMKIFHNHKNSLFGIITIPEMNKSTFGTDIKDMLENKITFDDYINSDKFMIMPRQRIKKVKNILYTNISTVI